MPVVREEMKQLVLGYMGEFRVVLDDKNRLTLPAKLRHTVPQAKSRSRKTKARFVLTLGYEGSLVLYPAAEWMHLRESDSATSFTQKNDRDYQRDLYRWASELVLDAQGRIPISERHKGIAGIDRDAVVVGVNRLIEIWQPERYEEYLKSKTRYEDAAEAKYKQP